jgi:hypothetical protein
MRNNTEISDIVHCLTVCGCIAPLPRQCVPGRAAGILWLVKLPEGCFREEKVRFLTAVSTRY